MLRSLIVAACLYAAASSPALAQMEMLFQGPWNVNAQPMQARTIAGYKARSGGEASVSAKLRGVIATIRAKYGRGAISGIGGARGGDVAGRPGMASCHNGGHAFDAHLSAAARRYVQGRRDLGVITYSGGMRHVHVSDCARERGYRGHKGS